MKIAQIAPLVESVPPQGYGGTERIVRYLTESDPDEDGIRRVFFEVNGQPLTILVTDRNLAVAKRSVEKADPSNPAHVAAPMPGLVVAVEVSAGQSISKGDTLLILEAMKMQHVHAAPVSGRLTALNAVEGDQVTTGFVVAEIEAAQDAA